MKMKKLERLGAIQYARTESQEQQLTALGYKVIGEEDVPDMDTEEKPAKNTEMKEVVEAVEEPLSDLTVAELREMLKKAGVNAPASANKAMLIEIAHANGM